MYITIYRLYNDNYSREYVSILNCEVMMGINRHYPHNNHDGGQILSFISALMTNDEKLGVHTANVWITSECESFHCFN